MCVYLSRVLQKVKPLLVRDTRLGLELAQVTKLAILAERENEQVVQTLRLRGPLALDDTSTRP